jgi:hypothetical protein
VNFSHDFIAKVIAMIAHLGEIVRLWIFSRRLRKVAQFVHDRNILFEFGGSEWEGAGHARRVAEKTTNSKKFFVFSGLFFVDIFFLDNP